MEMLLAIGDRRYSSWSLRGYLLMETVGAPYRSRHAPMRTEAFAELQRDLAPGRTVPMLQVGEALAWDSLAIAETLAEMFPDAGLWPDDSAPRAMARSMAAEMHSGFGALRSACPMNLGRRYAGFEPSDEVRADVERIVALWRLAQGGRGGPWLFGDRFGAVDAFFAPVASRFATYGLTDDSVAVAYMEAIHAHPQFRRWRAMGEAEARPLAHYEFDLPDAPRFGPVPLPARAVEGVRTVNETCPYSGEPVAADSLAEIEGVAVGFCNPFCRDKTVADAEAWPRAMAVVRAG